MKLGGSGGIGRLRHGLHRAADHYTEPCVCAALVCKQQCRYDGPDLANDDQPGAYWQCDIGQTSGWVEIDLEKPTIFNTVAVVEPTYLGEYGADSRIVSYRVEARSGRQWQEVFAGESPREIVYRVKPTSTERVRLSLRGTGKPPGIAEFGLYAESEPHLSRG
jgi:hypothetical protein